MSSHAAEDRFRQIFFAHLEADGFSEAQAYRLLFKTPDSCHRAPGENHGLNLLDDFRDTYEKQLAYGWYFEGLNQKPELNEHHLQAPPKPVTFVVIPGIFGEFIDQLPFQEILDQKSSRFNRKWQTALDEVTDRYYSLVDLAEVETPLSDLVKIGSIDQGERSFANVIVLRPMSGSLETLGSLASNVEIFLRRLTKVFEAISDDTDIYLVGYSRGLAVSLELVSTLHEQSKNGELPQNIESWYGRIKGVVGLGGVFYGANYAHEVLTGKSGATSELIKLLCETSGKLMTVPEDAKLAEKTSIVSSNAKVWSNFARHVAKVGTPKVGAGNRFRRMDLQETFSKEGKARILGLNVALPNPLGIFSVVTQFLTRTFKLQKSVTRYNENIMALQQLVEKVVIGVHTLTPASRDEWWRSHELPRNLEILSITGTMPEAYLNGFTSPLWQFKGFGAKMSDYNVSLLSAYYDALASENTLINDSQVSHFSSRYWEQMYPEHSYNHYYLGVLGTHHWGMAFPCTIKDDPKIGPNPFPRTTMLKSMATFITSLDEEQNSA